MKNNSLVRACVLSGLVAAGALCAGPAEAQFSPRPVPRYDPATGETYHIEFRAGYWSPKAQIAVASEQLGIVGTNIDFKTDLGLTDQRFGEMNLVLRPSKKAKFRFQYANIKYEATATLQRDVVFNGIRYRVGVPVNSILDWKAFGLGLEYDFFARDRWLAGLLLDVKYADVAVNLETPVIEPQFARVRAPIPALGGVVRVYVVRNISMTAELSAVKIPDSLSNDYKGHYLDLDVYGTVNFTDNIGAQIGYRSLDVAYQVKTDTGSLKLPGFYFGFVTRY
jgi:hypothetical protein